jgi:predicted nucleic acid-binding protein
MMTLRDIVNGTTVLIDASVLLYARNRRSPQCRELLSRCEQGAVNGVITLSTLEEFSHRCLVQEAVGNGLAAIDPVRTLAADPKLVCQLNACADSVRDLLDCSLVIAESHSQDFHVALELQKQFGLLIHDALNLAVARRHTIKNIAIVSCSFDQVPGLILYKPEEIAP